MTSHMTLTYSIIIAIEIEYSTMYTLAHAALTNLRMDHPIGKFVAVRMAMKFGTASTHPLTRTAFTRELGVPPNKALKPLGELEARGIIESFRQHWHPGPPHHCFRFNPETTWPNGYNELASSPHRSKIQQLLEYNEVPPNRRRHQLTIQQRVLLMVLLAHASPAGVVTSITRAELATQTGISHPRLRYECKNLKRYGYLRSTVDGGNFDRLLGRRSGAYFIELHHQTFGEDKPGGLTVIYPALQHPIARARRNSLERQRIANSSQPSNDLCRPDEDLIELIGRKPQFAELHYLAWVIDELASATLRNPELLTYPPPAHLLENLYAEVADTLPRAEGRGVDYREMPIGYAGQIQSAWKRVSLDDAPFDLALIGGDRRSRAQAFLVACIVQQATNAVNILSRTGESWKQSEDYLILPQPDGALNSRRIAVETYTSDADRTPHRVYVLLASKFRPDGTDATPEAIEAIANSLLEDTSLRTPPLVDPTLKTPPSAEWKPAT
ncbi:hypothetical protein [Salicola sp. Rm-C-2C1-2]|uniref:hypothetical protein n=1 Tax=Salicola sp. Rm-C-2C1-2 TaxID=3141321 RepID=UPI0032E39A34